MARVVVGVAIDQQGEAGRSPHLDESKRAGQQRQRRQQHGAAGGLVGLRAPGRHHRGQLAGPPGHQRSQRTDLGRRPEDPAGGSKQEVGLALGRRQALQKGEDRGIRGYGEGQPLVGRGPPRCLQPGKTAVFLGGRLHRIVPGHPPGRVGGHSPGEECAQADQIVWRLEAELNPVSAARVAVDQRIAGEHSADVSPPLPGQPQIDQAWSLPVRDLPFTQDEGRLVAVP